jgi:hypothetical protein
MLKDFPITKQAFIPVTELEKRNQAHLQKVQKAMAVHDSIQALNSVVQ